MGRVCCTLLERSKQAGGSGSKPNLMCMYESFQFCTPWRWSEFGLYIHDVATGSRERPGKGIKWQVGTHNSEIWNRISLMCADTLIICVLQQIWLWSVDSFLNRLCSLISKKMHGTATNFDMCCKSVRLILICMWICMCKRKCHVTDAKMSLSKSR